MRVFTHTESTNQKFSTLIWTLPFSKLFKTGSRFSKTPPCAFLYKRQSLSICPLLEIVKVHTDPGNPILTRWELIRQGRHLFSRSTFSLSMDLNLPFWIHHYSHRYNAWNGFPVLGASRSGASESFVVANVAISILLNHRVLKLLNRDGFTVTSEETELQEADGQYRGMRLSMWWWDGLRVWIVGLMGIWRM